MKKVFIWILLIWPVFMACKDAKDEPEPPEIENPDNPNKDEILTGTTGSLKWEANLTTGRLTISGTGEMPDRSSSIFDAPWPSLQIKTIIIGEGVTGIGGYTFQFLPNLTDVTIPKTVKKIGTNAFIGCEKLTSIVLPEGVTDIGTFAFSQTGLTSVKLPNSLQTLESAAFTHCHDLKSIVLPDNLHSIGDGAFDACHSLASVTLPRNLQTIERRAFAYSALTAIDFPENLKEIGENAFLGTGLTDITLPKSLTTIGDFAFNTVTPVVTIHVPNGMKGKFYMMLFAGREKYRIIDGAEDVSVIDLGDGLYLPGKSADPHGTLVKVKITGKQFQEILNGDGFVFSFYRNIYTRFNDDFDYILALMDTITGEGEIDVFHPIGNDVQGIGREIYSSAEGYGAGASLRGQIFAPSKDIINASLPHEICHDYANYIVKSYSIENRDPIGHWGIIHIANGGITDQNG